MWSDRPCTCGSPAGEGPGRPDRVREVAVPQPASTLWPLTAAPPRSACRAGQPHLSTLLHAAGGKDTYRDANPRHAAIRELHQLALRTRTVNTSGLQNEMDRDQIGRRQSSQRLQQIQTECYKYKLKSLLKSAVPILALYILVDVTLKLFSGKQHGQLSFNIIIYVCSTCQFALNTV